MRPSGEPITTVVADDHAVVRDGLRTVLERTRGEFEVVAEAADVPATCAAVRTHRPRLLIVDVTMPGGSSIARLSELRAEDPELAVVVLTMVAVRAFDPRLMWDEAATRASVAEIEAEHVPG